MVGCKAFTEKDRRRTVLLVGICLVACVACGGLPDDFGTLPLEEQVTAYERNFERYGGSLTEARAHISLHGWEAADLMAKYLSGERMGLPKLEAIRIIHEVQRRGCSLRGSQAEHALKEFLITTPAGTVEARFAETALYAISNNVVTPGGPDPIKGGPCEAAQGAK